MLDQNDNGDMYEPLSGSIADEESLVPAHPESTLVIGVESTTVRKCLCQHTSQIYITTSNSSGNVSNQFNSDCIIERTNNNIHCL